MNNLRTSYSGGIKSLGQSMRPFFFDGDIILLKKAPLSRIKPNDIIMVGKKNRFVTHRVVYKSFDDKPYIITKGDNNILSDGKSFAEHVIGRVVAVKRDGNTLDPESFYLFQSTLYFQEIVEVKRELEKKNIPFAFLKGLPLHLYFEKTHPRRMYFDCDVVIKKENNSIIENLLRKRGYKKAKEALSGLRLYSGQPKETSYYKMINGFRVVFDVHTEIVFHMTQLGSLELLYQQKLIERLTDEFLRNRRMIRIYNESFPILSPTDLLIYLALHIFHHNFRGYFRYEFLRKVITEEGVYVRDFANKVQQYKLQNFILPVFLLLKKHYKLPLPQGFLISFGVQKQVKNYIKREIVHTDIFSDEGRIKAGVARFRHFFHLSPRSFLIKLFIFSNPEVFNAITWVIRRLVIRSVRFKLQFPSFSAV